MREKNRHGGENRSGEIRWDFSVNINPLGMPEAAKAALLSGWNVFENYPDDGCEALRQALAGRFGVDGGQVVCGNGASDLIYRLCACGGFRRVLLPVPSFSEYQRALEFSGGQAEFFYTEEDCGFVPDERILEAITRDFDALFLCNPGNPAGGLVGRELMERIIVRCREMSVTLIVDECFLDFVPEGARHSVLSILRSSSDSGENTAAENTMEECDIVVIKAFTKIFAMVGLRLGFGIFGRKELAKRVFCWGAPWQVSGPAQTAGLAILEASGLRAPDGYVSPARREEGVGKSDLPETVWDGFVRKTELYIADQRRILENELRELGFRTVPGCANYILFCGPAGLDQLLARRGFSIRCCSDYTGLNRADEWGKTAGVKRPVADECRKTDSIGQNGPGECEKARLHAGLPGEKRICKEGRSGRHGVSGDMEYYRIAVRDRAENRLLLQEMRRCIEWLSIS